VSGAVQSFTLNPTNSAVAVVATTNGGLWRTTDSGSTWTPVAQSNTTFTSLSFGAVAYDATDSNVLVAGYGRFSSLGGRGGAQAGMLRSTDGGVTWASINGAGSVIPRHHQVTTSGVSNVKFAFGANDTAWAAVVNNSGVVNGVFRSADNGATWSAASLDTAVGGSTLNPGFQGGTHLSITADPTNDQIVYVGGDRTPASPFGAQMFRINSSLASGSQGSLFYGADTSNNSIPHADTRSMGFDAAGRFWLANDGGMYRRDDVTAGAGQWVSLNAGLRTTEVTGVAYHRLTKALITGQQDNATAVMAPGTTVNTAFASKVWTSLLSGDGGLLALSGAAGRWRFRRSAATRPVTVIAA
jgi:hypothetical protein